MCCGEEHGHHHGHHHRHHDHGCRCGEDSRCECEREDERGQCECGSCCKEDGGFRRRYKTRAEQIAELEAYLADLKAEVQAAEERLGELRG
jgi:hypothetical protein